MTWGAKPVLVALVAAALSCSPRTESPPAPTYGALGGEVASVGNAPIGASLVAGVAAARGMDARAAVDALIEDALAAEGARAAGLDRASGAAWPSTVALARRIPLELAEEARAAGPPTRDELASLTVIHALVFRTHSLESGRGLAIARSIAEAVAGARNEDEFRDRAAAVSRVVRTSIEKLPAFDASGRTEDGKELDPDFVNGAFALHAPGETSPVVETSFGWHVIRLIAREPPAAADLDARRDAVSPVVQGLRARIRLAAVLRARRERTRIEVSPAAEELTSPAAATP